MTVDIPAATGFITTHARILDRHRLRHLIDPGDESAAERALAALRAYRNPDGGYGWGLEADLRSPESQPGPALHAFEVWADLGISDPDAIALCDWLGSIARPDGGVPFALPVSDPTGSAPWWLGADTTGSSLQITAAVLINALRVAAIDPAVARHPWVQAATRYCLDEIAALEQHPPAHILSYSLRLLDELAGRIPEAEALVARLVAYLPADGVLAVGGGAEGEALRPLDYSPEPGTAVRARLAAAAVERDLQRLLELQQDDGGWPIDWAVSSPVATLEWRGYVTVRALRLLQQNRRLTLD